tara:strand:+ start:1861 stop:2052 length:192 start_codon:yes stop_codon:yes gene_type:complete
MANDKLKAGNKKKKKGKKSDTLKAGIPDDLFYDPKTKSYHQKVSDDGIPNQRWLQLQGRRIRA